MKRNLLTGFRTIKKGLLNRGFVPLYLRTMKKLLMTLIVVLFLFTCEKDIEITQTQTQTQTMAQQDLNIGSSYDDPSADSARIAFDKIQDNFDELYAQDVATIAEVDALQTQVSTPIKEVVSIGVWDMDTDGTKDVSWSLPVGMSIRSIDVIILADSGSSAYPLEYVDFGTMYAQGHCYYDGSNFKLARLAAGVFDSASYNGAGIRGFITVTYDVENPA